MAQRNIGNQVDGSQMVQFPPGGYKAVCRFQNTSGADLLITDFYGRWGIASGTAKAKSVIYSDNSGAPGSLLAISDEKIGLTNGVWNKLHFSTQITIPSGGYCWFGVISDTTMYCGACSTQSGGIKYNANTYASGPSGTFGTPLTADYIYRMVLIGEDNTLSFGRRSYDTPYGTDGHYQPDREHIDKVVLGGAVNVNVTSISTYITSTSLVAKSKAAIYSDSSGFPGTKLAQSSEVTGSTANSWLNLPIPGGVVLPPGIYWLAFITDTDLTTGVIYVSGSLIVDGPLIEATAFPSSYPSSGGYFFVAPEGIDIFASYESLVVPGGNKPFMIFFN